jgi:hypothetical protein
VIFGGMVDDAMEQQRPVLHQAEHGIPLPGNFLDRRPSPVGCKVSEQMGRLAMLANVLG